MIKSLNGKWNFRKYGDQVWDEAAVPGCNYLDLLNLGKIDDPFIGLNEEKAYWVALCDWEYQKTFCVESAQLESDRVFLVCKMLDTVCDVFLNGKKIASAENCHREYVFSVKEFLVPEENELRIVFRSPVNYVKEVCKGKMVPPNANGQDGIVFMRKPQCHFGWDWGPVLPPVGIGRDIYLDFVNTAKIDNVDITQKHADGVVEVSVECEKELFSSGETQTVITLTSPDGKEQQITADKAIFTVENPELWWTYELSGKDEQPLYEVSVKLICKGEVVDEVKKKIGLRTVELDRSIDEYGSNFRFLINGKPMFAKGANYIPADSFATRFDREKIAYLLQAARFSNMNMLRIWGGGYYESDEFYDACDRMGILLWQDFAFACQPYPFFEESFLENVREEIKYNVQRLKSHASLALWSGNNEIEAMSGGWINFQKYIKWTDIFFHQMLEKEIRKYDGTTSFIPGSPCGVSHNKGVNSDNVGDTHLWSVWHGLSSMKEYRNRMTRFCSEFGFESLPDIKTIRTFATQKDYSLDSRVFTAHQKCNSGNNRMLYYIRSRYNLPAKFEDFVYLSQITQSECMQDATEHWRRNKGRCNGALYWQFNDCWPVCSWSSLDYYGNYKALQYTAKHFNAPLTVSIEDTEEKVKVFVLNDLHESQNVTVEYSFFNFEKGVTDSDEREVPLKEFSNETVFEFSVSDLKSRYNLKKTGLSVSLIKDGEKIAKRVLLFGNEKDIRLPKPELQLSVKPGNGQLEITVSTDKYARFVNVSSDFCTLPFSDNFFDMLPGESRVITLPCEENQSKVLADSLSVTSLGNIETRKISFKERMNLTKMLLSPATIGGCIYHRRVPADIKIEG